ncbi:MAG: GFA family protein [Methylophilaceae bacterium]
MSTIVEAHGKCLCGAVAVTAKTMDTEVGACHCNMCRKWTGGIFLVVDCKDQVEFTDEENISVYNSSEWAERGFCAKCGTHLFYRLKENNQHFMPSELFDTDTKLHFGHQIFIEEKPKYYAFANDTKNMTGKELFAQFTDK